MRNVVFPPDYTSHHSARITRKKYCVLSGLFYPIPYIHQALHQVISIFFFLYKNALRDKLFPKEDQMKMFVENLLSSKAAEFYLRGINKPPDKWPELIHNNGKYTIDWK